jgi:RNA polymerase sigma-70 factor (ECF subfamily)
MDVAERATDAELLREAAADQAAFTAFYRRYVRRVTGFAARRCSSPEDLADVVAETFARLLDAADRYDPERGEPVSFVLGIAANVARDLHRRQARHGSLVLRLAGRDMLDADDIERADAAIDAARAARAALEAVAAAPASEREMLRLVAEGHSPGEAADRLGISPAAGWARLSRARRRLRLGLAPLPGGTGADEPGGTK